MSDDLRAQLSLSLDSSYIVDRELEGGSKSRVFVAKELQTDRDVVVKVLLPSVTEGVSAERFAREVHLAGALQEPHTVPILTTGVTTNGLLYYTMPFVRAETLSECMAKGYVAFDDALMALRDVARAMDHAHQQGIVHRHIEPGKVFLLKNAAVISDFGIAKALEVARAGDAGPRLKLVGSSLGVPAYMAPEHATSDPAADHRADIYAWGVMAYEVLSDGHPFSQLTSSEDLMAAHVSEPVPVLLHRRFGVPDQLAALVMRCLAKDPAERPASAAELLTVLERIPSGSSTLALESKTAVRWIGASIGLALALFIAGATALWRLHSRDTGVLPILAVLPFESNGLVSDSLFASGMESAVTERLARVATMRVIDRGSTLDLPRATRYAVESGKKLDADYVLSTSLRWFHDVDGTPLVQVSPSLQHIPDGKVKWTGSPAIVSPAEPFSAHAVLATQVAQALGVLLTNDAKSALALAGTRDLRAFAELNHAERLYAENRTSSVDAYMQALDHFERAIAIDRRYADAMGGAALMFLRVAQLTDRADLLDSASRYARRARSIVPDEPRSLIVASAAALAASRPEEALSDLELPSAPIVSNADALIQHASLVLLFRDSTAAWSDVERLVAVAPRSTVALLAAANQASALRRFNDAREFLAAARQIDPTRPDLLLAQARLARAEGRWAMVSTGVRAFRALGGRLGANDLDLLRVGDELMQRELATAVPATLGVVTRQDSVRYFTEKGKLFLMRKDAVIASAMFDSAAAMLGALARDPRVSSWDQRQYAKQIGWADAARGERQRALASINEIDRFAALQRWRYGKLAAMTACNSAEIFGFIGDVDHMLVDLRPCLQLPGGLSADALVNEPAFARFLSDPRTHALLRELRLDDAGRG